MRKTSALGQGGTSGGFWEYLTGYGLSIEEPTPALRDRVKSSQDFTCAPPLQWRGFSREPRLSPCGTTEDENDSPLSSSMTDETFRAHRHTRPRLFWEVRAEFEDEHEDDEDVSAEGRVT